MKGEEFQPFAVSIKAARLSHRGNKKQCIHTYGPNAEWDRIDCAQDIELPYNQVKEPATAGQLLYNRERTDSTSSMCSPRGEESDLCETSFSADDSFSSHPMHSL